MEHSEIIRRVGPEKLKEWLGASSRSLVDWRVRGIPARLWARLIELSAADPNLSAITSHDLESGRAAKVRTKEAA